MALNKSVYSNELFYTTTYAKNTTCDSENAGGGSEASKVTIQTLAAPLQ